LANGRQAHVLVNRGFVPERLRDAMSRSTGQVEGAVRITGHIRAAETRSAFTPADTPEKGVWYTRDPRAMAAYLKLPDAAPFVIDADGPENPGGWPKPGAARIRIPNNHLSYALTWFGLAATLLGVFAACGWRRLRERG
ncbi:MAG: SURF1 family protein, partial [Alphaproteobacteria bacterium]|nr:SURF1 family protein [Alphaproteobacteria bacterium]